MDLDSFFVSVERLFDKNLVGKPVIVGGTSNRGVVSSCSYEARKFGVQSAMPIVQARKLCPQGIFVRGRYEEYGRFSGMVTDIITDKSPLFEKASVDEFYVDLTGMDKYFGVYDWSTNLRKKIISETGLPISFGLSVNKMLAKMATNEAKPNGQYMIEPGKEQGFLDPKPVSRIPFCGEKTVAYLKKRGVDTIYQLRQFSIEALENWLGKHGVYLWQRAHGIDNSEVHPFHDSKSISSERTFSTDTGDRDWLGRVIVGLVEKIAFELRGDKRLTTCVGVKIRYADFSTHTIQRAITATANTKVLTEYALRLFDEGYRDNNKVRLLGVKFTELVNGGYPINLFEDNEKGVQLYKAIDELKDKHGTNKITLAQNIHKSNLKSNDR